MNPILLAAIPIVIHGNGNGLWSPNGSVPNMPVLPQQSQAVYNSPVHTPPPVVVEEPLAEVPDVCPTLQSRPQLCQ